MLGDCLLCEPYNCSRVNRSGIATFASTNVRLFELYTERYIAEMEEPTFADFAHKSPSLLVTGRIGYASHTVSSGGRKVTPAPLLLRDEFRLHVERRG